MRPEPRSSIARPWPGLLAAFACATALAIEAAREPGALAQDPPAKKAAAPAKKKAAPAAKPAPTKPAAKPTAKPEAASGPVDGFWVEPEQQKIWDLDKLTAADEARLGADLDRVIRRYHPPLEDGPLPRRLADAAEPYLKLVARKDVNYTFTVLDCEGSNAFSLPGGYVYVCRGLFDWICEDEDYALEFLIAHEMAHVDLAHAITNLRGPDVKKLNLGTALLFFSVAIPWGNTEAQEYEADKWARERMKTLGRSNYETISFLRKLEDYSKKNGFENYPRKPTDKPEVPAIDNHIRAHPVPYKRLRALKSLIASAPRS